jgi:2-polyprenyl-3-methyl-5-hydroxy-6-metoxy-1,4-benzoquinol methylase
MWFAKNQEEISYPEEANDAFFEIEENSFWFKHRNNCIINVIEKYSTKKILFDIGGGNGFISKGLEKNNIEAILVEPGIKGALNGKKRNLKNIICSSFQEAKFKDKSIPNIGIFDVLEHIEKDNAFLDDLHQVLSDDGKLFITVPAFKFLWSNEDVSSGHFRRYTINQLNKKLNASNFEMVYSTYIFSILPLPIFLLRTIPSWFSKAKELDYEKESQRHSPSNKKSIIDSVWDKEIDFIKKGKKIPFGGSCLIVAKKK